MQINVWPRNIIKISTTIAQLGCTAGSGNTDQSNLIRNADFLPKRIGIKTEEKGRSEVGESDS